MGGIEVENGCYDGVDDDGECLEVAECWEKVGAGIAHFSHDSYIGLGAGVGEADVEDRDHALGECGFTEENNFPGKALRSVLGTFDAEGDHDNWEGDD